MTGGNPSSDCAVGSTTWSLGVRLGCFVKGGQRPTLKQSESSAQYSKRVGQSSFARLGYALLLRALVAVGGAIAAYGATGMFTTAGITAPNAIVLAGLAASGAAALALWKSERTLTGIWPALLVAAVPFSLYAIGSLDRDECPQWHAPSQPPAHPLLVACGDGAIDGVGVRLVAEVQTRDLHTLPVDIREAVEDTVGVVDDVDRQPRERLALGGRLEPEEHVALDGELRRERWCQLRLPRARGDDELLGFECPGRGGDTHPLTRGRPARDRLLEAQRRAVLLSEAEVRLDRALRREPSGLRLEHALPAIRPLEERVTPT